MPELPKDQARVLRALYEWCFVGRGEGASRSRLERVPDYVLAAELDDSGVDARACLDVLVTRGLARRLGRGDSGGTWTLPGGRALRVSLRQTGEGPARLFYADVYVQDPGGPWRPIVELAGIEPCGTVFDLTPAGVDAAEQLPNSPAAQLGAGAAFMRAVEHDPEAQAALKRAQARLRTFADLLKDPAFQREHERARREQEQAFQALADAIRESVRAAQQDLGDLGFMPPKTLEDWEHLARVVEMPFETIQAGNFSARDVYVMALAWVDRQRMKSRVGVNGEPPAITPAVTAEAGPKVATDAHATAPADAKPVDPIPLTWLRGQVPPSKVKGDASKLAAWLTRRNVRVYKVAGKNYAERADLLRVFKAGSRVHELIAEYNGDGE